MMKRWLTLIAISLFLGVGTVHADEVKVTLAWDTHFAVENITGYELEVSHSFLPPMAWKLVGKLCKDPEDDVLCQNKGPIDFNNPENLRMSQDVPTNGQMFIWRVWGVNVWGRSFQTSNLVVITAQGPNPVRNLRIQDMTKVPTLE